MTDAEKVSTLRSAIERADKALDWVLEQPGHSEWMMTTASRIRRVLRAAMKKTGGAQAARAPGQALDGSCSADVPSAERTPVKIKLPEVRLDIQAMKSNGTLKEARRVDKRKKS